MDIKLKKPTISDIARCAGVSKTTVSRYINGKYEFMSDETRQRIKNIIELVEYAPSALARSLKSRKSQLIGLVIADIENPFSASIIKGATDALHQAGYNILVASTNNSIQKEMEYIRSFMSQGVDGLIVNTASWDNEFLIFLANSGMPIVLADREVKNYDFDIAYIENQRSMARAVKHVFESGYQHIALFSWNYQAFSPRYYRQESFVQSLQALGYANSQENVHVFDTDSDEGVKDAVKTIVEQSRKDKAPPAIITANEILLLKAFKVARELDIHIPGQLGLCGYDDWGWVPNMIWPSIMCPRITTLTAQSHNLGELTSRLLLDRLANPDADKQHIAIETELIVRESTALNLVAGKRRRTDRIITDTCR